MRGIRTPADPPPRSAPPLPLPLSPLPLEEGRHLPPPGNEHSVSHIHIRRPGLPPGAPTSSPTDALGEGKHFWLLKKEVGSASHTAGKDSDTGGSPDGGSRQKAQYSS